ncbi:uncharacterized protein [Lepeophtheirus salmonis]|uniref:uncharacterized protein n=1 Tax=Lepeophtheirus salmonis TaxID=72036 RepID=UPI001AE32799|nr:mucin-5AC-like [Lepeophtheirus salmonis]
MKEFSFPTLCLLSLSFGIVLSDSSTAKENGESSQRSGRTSRQFSHFDTEEFLNFDDERPSVVVKTSRVTSSSSSVSTSLRRSLVGRGGSPIPFSTTERPTTPMATILQQINEHNEDGSYTYGYEASDGSFKLETRYPDGRVQGKYGYVDDNGEQKVIEYGADMLGFQPQGDLPEGIIVPPPVFNNETESSEAQVAEPIADYDYDYSNASEDGKRTRFVIKNRARTSNFRQDAAQPSASAPTRGREQSLRQSLESQPKIHFSDRLQTNFEPQRSRLPPVPHPPIPTAAPVHQNIQSSRAPAIQFAPTPRPQTSRTVFTTTATTTRTPLPPRTTTATPSIVEIPQVPRKVRIHHASRLTTTPPPHDSRTSSPQKISRSRRPSLPSSGSPDPLEALKAFMLSSNGPLANFGISRQHTPRRLRPPHRSGSSSEPRAIPSSSFSSRGSSPSKGSFSSTSSKESSPSFSSSRGSSPSRGVSKTPKPSSSSSRVGSSTLSHFSSFPARSNNQGANSVAHSPPSLSSTTAFPPPQDPSQSSLKLPPSFQEQRRPIRILTSAVPGASLNRLPTVTEKPKPGEIVPTDVDFDALIQEFTGQRRRQESSPFLSSSSDRDFPHFTVRTSGPSSLELFADFSK